MTFTPQSLTPGASQTADPSAGVTASTDAVTAGAAVWSAPPAVIHPSAIVDDGAELGPDTRVWHFAHVCAGARIGAYCSLGQNVFVGNDVRLGNQVKVQNNVSIYDAVTLEDEVFCGPSMVFTNVYNPRAAVPRKHEYRRTLVRRGASIGANATIVCGVTIGEYAFIAAGAVVNRDVAPYALIAGVPARHIGWISRTGARLALPLSGNGEARCPDTGEFYVLHDGVCSLAEASFDAARGAADKASRAPAAPAREDSPGLESSAGSGIRPSAGASSSSSSSSGPGSGSGSSSCISRNIGADADNASDRAAGAADTDTDTDTAADADADADTARG